jgi:HEAT repeat protein
MSKNATPKSRLTALLKTGDRRSIGRSNEVSAAAADDPKLFAELVRAIWHADPAARMRAADAVEKASRKNPGLLRPHKAELLGLMIEEEQKEVRWHLAGIVPRLQLSAEERNRAAAALRRYLEDSSSIVRTFALQGLADLSAADAGLRHEVVELLHQAVGAGTPAMKARARNLLAAFEKKATRKRRKG